MLNRPPIRVLCVDDHAMLVEGLQSRLELERDIALVGHLTTADELADEVGRTGANVVLLDIEMPGQDPFDAMHELRRRDSSARVIMLSAFIRDRYVDAAIDAGAWGFMSKSDDPDSVVQGIRQVARGEMTFGPEVRRRLDIVEPPAHARGKAKRRTGGSTLTRREQQILRLIGKGMSRNEIAREIHRSPKTVDAHRGSLMMKLDIHSQVELARYAIREGLVEA